MPATAKFSRPYAQVWLLQCDKHSWRPLWNCFQKRWFFDLFHGDWSWIKKYSIANIHCVAWCLNVKVPLSSQVVRLCEGQEVECRGSYVCPLWRVSMIMGGNKSSMLTRKCFQSLFSDSHGTDLSQLSSLISVLHSHLCNYCCYPPRPRSVLMCFCPLAHSCNIWDLVDNSFLFFLNY